MLPLCFCSVLWEGVLDLAAWQGVPGPRSPLGHEDVTDRCWAAVEAEAKALVQLPHRHMGPLCSYMKGEIRTFLCV